MCCISVNLERIIQQSSFIALFSRQEDVVNISCTWVVFLDRLHAVMPCHSSVAFLISTYAFTYKIPYLHAYLERRGGKWKTKWHWIALTHIHSFCSLTSVPGLTNDSYREDFVCFPTKVQNGVHALVFWVPIFKTGIYQSVCRMCAVIFCETHSRRKGKKEIIIFAALYLCGWNF